MVFGVTICTNLQEKTRFNAVYKGLISDTGLEYCNLQVVATTLREVLRVRTSRPDQVPIHDLTPTPTVPLTTANSATFLLPSSQ